MGRRPRRRARQRSASPDPQNFTPFDQITQARALSWVSAAVDVAALKAELAARFNAPSVATGFVSMAPSFPNT
jgi:hypothetical protein